MGLTEPGRRFECARSNTIILRRLNIARELYIRLPASYCYEDSRQVSSYYVNLRLYIHYTTSRAALSPPRSLTLFAGRPLDERVRISFGRGNSRERHGYAQRNGCGHVIPAYVTLLYYPSEWRLQPEKSNTFNSLVYVGCMYKIYRYLYSWSSTAYGAKPRVNNV